MQARPGASRKSIESQAAAQLEGLDPHAVFGKPAVKRMGLSLDDEITGQSEEDAIQPGAVYSIRVSASGPEGAAGVSALVRNGEVLWRSE
jgi:hypothetical protein